MASRERIQNFGSYALLGEITHGGMAEVHYAVARGSLAGPVIALKRILPKYAEDQSFRRFFAAECGLARCLHHPNVVESLDAGEVDGVPYLAMEYIHGRAVSRFLNAIATLGKRLPLPHAIYIGIQALRGLEYVHGARDASGRELRAVLCDISPSNIMVGYDGTVKLIDFGIATSQIKFLEQIGLLKGKKNYMAPEQLRGLPLDARADIFAMGLCLIELITARGVFAGQSEFEIEESVRNARVPNLTENLPNVSPGLAAALARAVAIDRTERYPSAGAFADALVPFARLGKGAAVGAADLAHVLRLYLPQVVEQDTQRLAQLMAGMAQAADSGPPEIPVLGSEPPTTPLGEGLGSKKPH